MTSWRTSVADRWRRFRTRFPTAAEFSAALGLVPPALFFLAAQAPTDPLSALQLTAVWALTAGTVGGAAIAVQHAFRQPRIVAPLFAAAIVLLGGASLWTVLGVVAPGSHALYAIAVMAPFVLAFSFIVTLAAVLIPARHRRRVGVGAIIISAALAALSVLL